METWLFPNDLYVVIKPVLWHLKNYHYETKQYLLESIARKDPSAWHQVDTHQGSQNE